MMAEGLYRLLVIDDEPEIIEWLTLLLETSLPFDAEVYGAGNATQALAVLEEVRVDVVVSDINMPKMSGLQLAQAIKARWKDCRIIFSRAMTGSSIFIQPRRLRTPVMC